MAEKSAHEHLCAKCNKIFECSDASDADLEFSVCAQCKELADKEAVKRAKRGNGRRSKSR